MLYLYLDESGDLGFDFVNKKPSKFFTICILMIHEAGDRKRIVKMIERTLRRKLNPKNKRSRQVQEIKGSETTLSIKNYFYRNIRKVPFEIYSITLNKKRVYPHLIEDKSRVYNWIARMLLDKMDLSGADHYIELILDKSKSKPEIAEFNKYILWQLEGKIDPKVPLKISHLDSCVDKCLNAVDLFAWGLFRKYERRDESWSGVYQEKVKVDMLYLP